MPRMLKLEAKVHRVEIVRTGPDLVMVCAQLRAACQAEGHALAQREHNADRWIAAAAIKTSEVPWSPTTGSSEMCRV